MSRSNNTELINPAQRFFSWAGQTGELQYFDKSLGEKGENVSVPLPFRFLVLDKVATVTGGIERNGSYEGFWSNAVKNTKTQQLVVRSKQGIEVQGYYDHIKGHPGVKFMTGLYVAFYDEDGTLQIGYVKLKGAALTAWIEFTRQHRDIYSGAFAIKGNAKKKKGATTYFEPVFQHYPKVSDESDEMAKELDRHLQEYLRLYFEQQAEPQAYAAAAGAGYADDGYTGPDMSQDPPDDDGYEDTVPF